ncbi:hypothetical protein [Desulfofalx alkaliphila]|uniref:hypothetical protein n=1 Tax=Desulfofalx alkaliphila TaxID=105483 RepID=UPI0004E10A13|nr:hypothetical protein [Desulfofalx alkaliphila]
MKYKNPKYRKKRNTFPLEVSCGNCKTPMVIYAKGSKGNLIKLQVHRIIASAVDLENNEGHLICTNCKEELAWKGSFDGNETYWIIRGKVNSKRLSGY